MRLQEKVLQTKWQESTNEVLMSTWEQLDDTSSVEETKEEEEANLYLMANTTSEWSNSESEEEVNKTTLKLFNYHIMSFSPTHPFCPKLIKIWERTFKSLSKYYKQLQGKHEEKIDNSSEISTQSCDDFECLKLKTT